MREVSEPTDLHVFQTTTETVIAESVEDAFAVLAKDVGEDTAREILVDAVFAQQPDDKPIDVWDEDGLVKRTKTCGEWVAELGRTYVGSTEV